MPAIIRVEYGGTYKEERRIPFRGHVRVGPGDRPAIRVSFVRRTTRDFLSSVCNIEHLLRAHSYAYDFLDVPPRSWA